MILVVSYPGDEHTDDVVHRLRRTGYRVEELNFADFPARGSMEFTWTPDAENRFNLRSGAAAFDLRECRVVWWRRVNPFVVDDRISQQFSPFAMSETAQAMMGALDSLACPWVNPRDADAAAHHKPLQWTIAREIGLALPRTLVTNSVDHARSFLNEVGMEQVVFKAFLASMDAWRETRLVTGADIEKLESVRLAPVIFQEYVPGVDLRITMIGDSVFAAEIDARKTSYPVDMRMVVGESLVQEVELPDAVLFSLRLLMNRLGLVYGAVDMRRMDDGRHVFLEVNPAGQWLFVEQRTGMQISQAIANYIGTRAGLPQVTAARPRENEELKSHHVQTGSLY